MRRILLAILLLGLCHMCASKYYRAPANSGGGDKYRASNLRTWSKSQKAVALTAGSVYISSRMRSRYGSPDYYINQDVQICLNKDKYPEYNGTIWVYGWFLCPVDDENKGHCCGGEGDEYCCNFWKSTSAIGAYCGFAILGVGFIAGIIVLVIWLKKKKIAKPAPENNTVSFNSQPANQKSPDSGTVTPPPAYSYSNPGLENTGFEKNQYGFGQPTEYEKTGGAPA